MKKLILLCLFLQIFSFAQSNSDYVLYFNGVNSYVDLGNEIANGVRTIEFWFKPLETISSDLSFDAPKTFNCKRRFGF